ncbi:Helitron helicase [Phytophthora megakarya]|uniref:Helitron helicase n=1 Tax=Phytophthora megakarya TaxID=4795 RepID=A0A225WH32_9STRA|nr:Helitron helicase [Phytophthora megakarya]
MSGLFREIRLPFKLRQKPFPVVPAFVMTVNKAQGPSIHQVGIYLESILFAHGELYCSLIQGDFKENDPSAIDENGTIHSKNITFPGETAKCCCIDGKVKMPPRLETFHKLRLRFSNPVFMKSICAYNNVTAFTSVKTTQSDPLRVDESVTKRRRTP